MKLFTKTVLLFLLTLVTIKTNARKFYFSTSGSDAYTTAQAQNPATPWQSLVKLNSFADNGAAAGDTFLFKRGDVFANGYNRRVSLKWYANSEGYTCATGTAQNPIVFTYYGDMNLERPNFLFPFPSSVPNTDRYNMCFKNVSYFVFDGLQFNDIRFPVLDKRTSCYTATGLMFGEDMESGVDHFTVRDCNFTNIGYGILSNGSDFLIHNNTFTNFKSVGDTLGTFDIGADALQISGKKYRITNNYISGSWAYANPYNSSSNGLLGGALETINDFDSSYVANNMFIDNSGGMEFGQNRGTQYGPNDDTFAYNFFINNSNVSYVNTTGTFKCSAARLHFWNNVIIENEKSRFTGRNNGGDALGNGQTYVSSGFIYAPQLPPSKSTFTPQEYNYYSAWRTFDCGDQSFVPGDTLYDVKNNVIWNTNGLQVKSSPSRRPKDHYKNNIYHIKGSYQIATNLGDGAVLSAGERIINTKLFTDTSNAFPQNWDFHITSDTSYAANNGLVIPGLTTDYGGNPIVGNPSIGVYEFGSSTPVSTPLSASLTSTSISCNGGTSTINVSATGGTAPYVGTGSFTVNAGSYSYIVTDATGSRDTVNVTINQPTLITATVTPGTIAITGGSTTATVSNVVGGTGNTYTYSLDGGAFQSSNTFSGVLAGSHAIRIKDINGCIISKSFFIDAPVVSTLTANAVAGLISCNGGTTTVTVSAAGGVSPLTGTGVFTASAGLNNYTVTDAAGTTVTTSVTISEPTAISLSLTSGTITSTGGTTSITATATGGTSAYTYKLNSGTYQSSNVFSTVAAGTYTVTVKDANGCTKSGTISISQPSSIFNATATAGTIACNGGTTTITVSAAGGTAPYTGTGTFTVSAGTYTYNVTDANGVVDVVSVTVSEPTAISLSLTSGTITSTGGTTSITATATGGTSAYTYKLNSGTYQSSNVFSTVAAGTYTVTVKDANGCTKSGTISISQPSSIFNATATAGTIACNGGTTTITVSAAGGTAPYTGTGTFTVSAGTYTYNVTDANGVVDVVSVTVSQPALILVELASGSITVAGGSTFISANVTGGSAPYSFTLDNGTYQTSNLFNNVIAGTHIVTVKDSKGCVANRTITIASYNVDSMVVSVNAGTISCNGGTAIVNVTATGGVAPYIGVGSYTMSAGLNTITVIDAAGTTQTYSITLTQPSEINVVVSVRNTEVVSGGKTSIKIIATGGTGTYRYSLDGGAFQTTNSYRGIGAGTHMVSVVDQNGCVKMASFIVTEINANVGLSISLISRSNVTCIGANNGSISVGAAGGRAPYSYTINGVDYITDGKFTNLAPGTYTTTVKDYNGNTAQIEITILDGKKRCGTYTNSLSFKVYPNPSISNFKVNISTEELGEITLQVFDVLGKMVHQEKGQSAKLYNFGLNFKPGFYVVKVIQANQFMTSKIIKQ